jgi:hypothetical protein
VSFVVVFHGNKPSNEVSWEETFEGMHALVVPRGRVEGREGVHTHSATLGFVCMHVCVHAHA